MVCLSLASGLSDSPDGFPPAVPGVFSGSLPAPLGLGGELNSLLELLSSCCEEPTSPREVLDSLGILSLVLPPVSQGGGVLGGRGRSSAAQWLVSSWVLVGWMVALVSGRCSHVPPYSKAWLQWRLLVSPTRGALHSACWCGGF